MLNLNFHISLIPRITIVLQMMAQIRSNNLIEKGWEHWRSMAYAITKWWPHYNHAKHMNAHHLVFAYILNNTKRQQK